MDRIYSQQKERITKASQMFILLFMYLRAKLYIEIVDNFLFLFFTFAHVTLCDFELEMVIFVHIVYFPRAGTNNRRNALASCQLEKRSPFRYFEMRGKKNPRWELRGMFVGVRGKKWATAPYEDDSPFISMFDNTERIGVDGDSPAILGNSIS